MVTRVGLVDSKEITQLELGSSLSLSLSPSRGLTEKKRTIFEKGNIHGDKVLTRRRVKAFIASLMQRITDKNTCLSPRSKLR